MALNVKHYIILISGRKSATFTEIMDVKFPNKVYIWVENLRNTQIMHNTFPHKWIWEHFKQLSANSI